MQRYISDVMSEHIMRVVHAYRDGSLDILPMATGTGKTYAAAAAAARLLLEDDAKDDDSAVLFDRIIYITPIKEARDAFCNELYKAIDRLSESSATAAKLKSSVFVGSSQSDSAYDQLSKTDGAGIPLYRMLPSLVNDACTSLCDSSPAVTAALEAAGEVRLRMEACLIWKSNKNTMTTTGAFDDWKRGDADAQRTLDLALAKLKRAVGTIVSSEARHAGIQRLSNLAWLDMCGGDRWSWVERLWPEIRVKQAKVVICTHSKFWLGIDSVIDGRLDFLTCARQIVLVDESDVAKGVFLGTEAARAAASAVDPLRFCGHEADELRSKILHSSGEVGELLRGECSDRWSDCCSTIETTAREETMTASYKASDEVTKAASFFFLSDLAHYGRKGYGRLRVYYDAKSGLNRIVLAKDVGSRPVLNLSVAVSKAQRAVRKTAVALASTARRFAALRGVTPHGVFTMDEAVSTIAKELGLREEDDLLRMTLSLNRRKAPGNGPFAAMRAADTSVYTQGVALLTLWNSREHDTYTDIRLHSVDITPEAALVSLVGRSNSVFLLSATALVDSVRNWNLRWVVGAIGGEHVAMFTDQEIGELKILTASRGSDEWAVDCEAIVAPDGAALMLLRQWAQLCRSEHFLGCVAAGTATIDTYSLQRAWRICAVYKRFLDDSDIGSFLCITPNNLSNDAFIMALLREMHAARSDAGIGAFEDVCRPIDADAMRSGAHREIIHALGDGRKTFILTSYSTASSALNFQYPIPKGADVIRLGGYYPSDYKDIDGIYLELPTHMLASVEPSENQDGGYRERLLLQAYETDELVERCEITLSEGDRRRGSNHANIWRYPSAKNWAARYVNQSLGRIDRTGNKGRKTVVFFDGNGMPGKVNPYAFDADLAGYDYTSALWKAFKGALVDLAVERENADIRWSRSVDLANSRGLKLIDSLVHASLWTSDTIRSYEELGRDLLAHPVLRDEDIDVDHASYRLLMIDSSRMLEPIRYWYTQNDDYCEIDAYLEEKSDALEVSEERAHLPVIRRIDWLSDEFLRRDIALSWGRGEWAMSPVLFNNIYMGRIGEAVYAAWHAHVLDDMPQLDRLDNDPGAFELFDFRVRGTGIFIDVKHHSTWTAMDREGYRAKILAKAAEVSASRVILVSVFRDWQAIDDDVYGEGTVSSVARILLNDGSIDVTAAEFIRREIMAHGTKANV